MNTLVSTMNNNKEKISEMNLAEGYVVVNQNDYVDDIVETSTGKWINSLTKGLSVSRNIAIENSNEDICLIADDDLIYIKDYEVLIKDTFDSNPDYDVIAFMVEGVNAKFKDYNDSEKDIGYLSSMKLSSVEIAFRRNVIDKGIRFNEYFGSGGRYKMGEENIFLFDILRRKMKILFVPIKIADLKMGDSTWFKGYDDEYLFNRGASYYAMTPKLYPILILQYAVRKRVLFKPNNISVLDSIKIMCSGKKDYKNLLKNKGKTE